MDNLIKVTSIFENGYKTNCEKSISCTGANPKLVSLKQCGTCGSPNVSVVPYDATLESGVDVYGDGTLIISGTLDTFLAACAECCGTVGVVPVVPAPPPVVGATAPFTYCVTRLNDLAYQTTNNFVYDYVNKNVVSASLFSHDVVSKTSKYTLVTNSPVTSFIGSDTGTVGACV
jgi:hypothetical protein